MPVSQPVVAPPSTTTFDVKKPRPSNRGSRKRKSSDTPVDQLSTHSDLAAPTHPSDFPVSPVGGPADSSGTKRRRRSNVSGASGHRQRSSQGEDPSSSSPSDRAGAEGGSAPSSSSASSSDPESSVDPAKRTSREASPIARRGSSASSSSSSLRKLQSFAAEGSGDCPHMGNCIGKKAVISHETVPADEHPDKAAVEALTRSPERTARSPSASSNESPAELHKEEVVKEPIGKHGSRRRLSLIHADPITHKSEEGPRGTAQIIQTRPSEHRLSLEGVLSKNGAGTRVSIMGVAAHTLQKNFEDKHETCRGNVNGETLITMGIGHACRKGLKPESPNQDDFFIFRIEHIGLYGVFDGHGPFGHDISNFVQQNLPKLIYNHPDFYTDPKVSLKCAFQKVQEDIEKACERRDFDAALSGCTATVIIHDIEKKKLYVAHVGDSRAVLAQRNSEGQVKAVDLTNDHKPTMEGEKARIESKGGEVKRLEGDIPFRVFLKDKMYPGLAMSR
eukprot:Gregarina_sp_Poly_1__300@NODE_1074_length_5174_cov_263_109262_g746_i0_p2_GENE_NODE_1074_length_5174_cov_263_109262_g746_i0NODE_1074_length_5174_cov_263_109262_g746_i0_p2_ORF_typecomplete_len504_score93_47PP2C/PF00481_21/3_3e35PP2C_2/PF13672_6/7_4e14SpoIIE/PF07228_12/0_00018_NODE_1074_length_5174_cov_263_109262_g746_i01051616